MALELTDIKNFEDLNAISTVASDDILPIVDLSDTGDPDKKITLNTLQQVLDIMGKKTHSNVTTTATNIAQVAAVSGNKASAVFTLTDSGGTTKVKVAVTMSTSTKTFSNTTCEILSRSGSPLITKVSLLVSDTVDAAGAYLNIKLSSSSDVVALISENSGNNAGWEHLATFNTATTTPAGGTASELVAGSELLLTSTATVNAPHVAVRKWDNNTLRFNIMSPEIIYPNATDVDITGLNIYSYDGTNAYMVDGTEAISIIGVDGHFISFVMTKTSAFTALPTNISLPCGGSNITALFS